jgi:hypothetical protein
MRAMAGCPRRYRRASWLIAVVGLTVTIVILADDEASGARGCR